MTFRIPVDGPTRACVCALLAAAATLVPTMPTAAGAVPDDRVTFFTIDQALFGPASEVAALFPKGVVVDSLSWEEGRLQLDVTLPAGTQWAPSPTECESISDAVNGVFLLWDNYAGSRIRVRIGEHADYNALEMYAPAQAAVIADAVVEEAPVPQTADNGSGNAITPTPAELRGFTNAARQPNGPLSGITVFASCGHGWTADDDDDTWILQRPVDQGMNEDHGNLDQLNYFVQYAYNAGATVVPFRPVGWQPQEVVIDNDSPNVVYTGAWASNTTSPKYHGHNAADRYRYAAVSPTETATARFIADIPETGFYPVFGFVIGSSNRALQTYRVKHSGGVSEVQVDHRMVGNGWVWLGNYYLEADGENWVEITNKSTSGDNVIADAIRWGCGMGDIVRPGPDTISGYSRDEECQRYWAQEVLGNNSTGFDASSIWDSSSTDQNDNVSTGARFAQEMNQQDYNNDRWRRIHLEFHTNAYSGIARGCIALVNSSNPTTNQQVYAEFMANEVDGDMTLLQDEFEHSWYDRPEEVLAGSYGAISALSNGNEFDATLIELAFHDNPEDAEMLRDIRVRSTMARSSVHGMIKFLNWLSAGEVPLAFAPDTPRNVAAVEAGNGDVVVSWQPPLSDEARGDPATGYVVYASSNGYGFGEPVVLGNVLSTTITGLAAGETRYYRVAATNDGGESMPSEVLAVYRPVEETPAVLIVNGFDRLRRDQNLVQTIPQGTFERQVWRHSNSFDYSVQHASAIAAYGSSVSTASNEAVRDGQIDLNAFDVVVWICGEESVEDATFDAQEQIIVEAYLENGGALFVSGSDIAYDLASEGDADSRAFYNGVFGATFSNSDANTYVAQGSAASIFEGLGQVAFSVADGAPYDADHPDRISVSLGARAALAYVGGSGGTAAVQFDSGLYRVVTLAFPFETIGDEGQRTEIMARALAYLEAEPVPYDFNSDGHLTTSDLGPFIFCLNASGPGVQYTGTVCGRLDLDRDGDIDLQEFARFQRAFNRQ